MTPAEYIAQAKTDITDRWFKAHKAKLYDLNFAGADPRVVIVDWRQPGTSNYAVRFILCGGTLYVSGDIGEAVYRWGERITVPWVGGLNMDYFLGKCCASEEGRRFQEFDGAVARHEILDLVKDHPDVKRKFREELRDALRDPNKETLDQAARALYDKTGDGEWASMVGSCGTVPAMRGIGHWMGIKMAAAQLTAAAEPEVASV